MNRIRRISRRVIYCYRVSVFGVGFLFGLILISSQTPVVGQSELDKPHLMAYLRVQEPQVLLETSSLVPTVFQENTFSIYLLNSFSSPLEWILVTKAGESAAWLDISTKNNWSLTDIPGYRLFFVESSKLKEEVAVIEFVKTHLDTATSTSLSGGLLPGWNAGLKQLYNNEKARIRLFERLFPGAADHSIDYADYLQWFAQELMSLSSVMLSIDKLGNEGKTTLRVSVVPGTRLYRFVSRKGSGSQAVLGFVPSNAEHLSYGSVDRIFASNYMNYYYKGTNLIDHDLFKIVRSGLNQLNAGFFDRWDGSWAKWTPQGAEASLLLLGGSFQSSDLGDLFDMLSAVDLSGTPISIQLDEENTVVGFSLIRSLDLLDSHDQDVGDLRPRRRYFFGVAREFLVISDSDSALIDLVFNINSRNILKDSAQALDLNDPSFTISSFDNENRVASLRMSDERIFYEKKGDSELANSLAVRIINILDL